MLDANIFQNILCVGLYYRLFFQIKSRWRFFLRRYTGKRKYIVKLLFFMS